MTVREMNWTVFWIIFKLATGCSREMCNFEVAGIWKNLNSSEIAGVMVNSWQSMSTLFQPHILEARDRNSENSQTLLPIMRTEIIN